MQTQTQTVKTEVAGDDVFVLVLIPKFTNFGTPKPFDTIDVCGRTMMQWIDNAIAGFAHRKVEVKKTDNIIDIVRKYATHHKYTAVIYADTPLLTKHTLQSALNHARSFLCTAVKLPRGWIFETAYINGAGAITPVEIPNLNRSDFVVVYGWEQHAKAVEIMRSRISNHFIRKGVLISDKNTTYIEADVQIESGVTIMPNVHLRGATIIRKGTIVKPGTIVDSSMIGENCMLGPYANIRPECLVADGCKIGNFVEVKKSVIGEGTKISHMTYVGDARVGKRCNIGCGVVFCNYDGKNKHVTNVGDDVFIGSNSNLVAPVTIESGSFIAAGSTITDDVPGGMAIARARQVNKADSEKPTPAGENSGKKFSVTVAQGAEPKAHGFASPRKGKILPEVVAEPEIIPEPETEPVFQHIVEDEPEPVEEEPIPVVEPEPVIIPDPEPEPESEEPEEVEPPPSSVGESITLPQDSEDDDLENNEIPEPDVVDDEPEDDDDEDEFDVEIYDEDEEGDEIPNHMAYEGNKDLYNKYNKSLLNQDDEKDPYEDTDEEG